MKYVEFDRDMGGHSAGSIHIAPSAVIAVDPTGEYTCTLWLITNKAVMVRHSETDALSLLRKGS
jgi:hypothetical protein